MTVTYELVEGLAVLILGGFILLWWNAPWLAKRTSANPGFPTVAMSRSRTIRTASAAVLAAIVVAAVGLRYVGVPLAPFDQPLQFGQSYEAGGPSLLARVDGQTLGSAEYDFAYAPGAEIRSGITLQNTGGLPLSVTGVVEDSTPYVSSVELRLPADPTAPNAPLDSGVNGPFRPFTIPAHGEATLAMVVIVGKCPTIPPTPTQAPDASNAAVVDDSPPSGGALTSVSEIRIGYTVLGLARTATIRLPFSQVVIGPPGTNGCPTA